jgi:DHA1 family inner membrane transport protein
LVFMGLFALGNGLAAAAPGFGSLLIARFLSGVPHGAFFGVAGLVAAQMGGPGKRAAAVGRLFLGLTLANLVGVPVATVFGGAVGWRFAFALIAVIALLCVVGMAVCLPRTTGGATAGGSASSWRCSARQRCCSHWHWSCSAAAACAGRGPRSPSRPDLGSTATPTGR